ncbi:MULTISPECIES: DUF2147 domain-containing protein [unclassified Acinetobacter]|uniref:DUF2147 domain-containing protein n=1 Tax=unclassified Acinetobacter TaxID=196816 RepID=UPI003A85C0E3
MKKVQFFSTLLLASFSHLALASDLSGTWRSIDDKTGSSKAFLEIRETSEGVYTAKITKITPRPGYTAKEICVSCPAPYTNKPILGLDVLTGLKYTGNNSFSQGKLLDPLSGNIYNTKAKLSANGKRLTLRGYVGVSALGRSQTWIKYE